MKTTLLLVLFSIFLFSVLFPLSLTAQTPDRLEVFGGYSYTTFSIFDRYSGPWQRFGYNGWEAAVAAKLVPHLAVEGDFAGGFSNPNGNSSTVRTFMGGARVFQNFGKAEVYAHVLVGGTELRGWRERLIDGGGRGRRRQHLGDPPHRGPPRSVRLSSQQFHLCCGPGEWRHQ